MSKHHSMGLEDYDLHGGDSPPYSESRALAASYLPEKGSLKNLDLDAELYAAYAKARNYLAEVQMAGDIPANQIAQVFNTLSGILKEIVKLQTELYNAERVKRLEAATIAAIKTAPKEVQERFFTEFERSSSDV